MFVVLTTKKKKHLGRWLTWCRTFKMYILGTNTAVMWKGLNVERLNTGCNITGGCRIMKKNKLCAKNETSLWENTHRVSVVFLLGALRYMPKPHLGTSGWNNCCLLGLLVWKRIKVHRKLAKRDTVLYLVLKFTKFSLKKMSSASVSNELTLASLSFGEGKHLCKIMDKSKPFLLFSLNWFFIKFI